MTSKKKHNAKDIWGSEYDKCDHVWDVISKSSISKTGKASQFIKIEKKCRRCKHVYIFLEKK